MNIYNLNDTIIVAKSEHDAWEFYKNTIDDTTVDYTIDQINPLTTRIWSTPKNITLEDINQKYIYNALELQRTPETKLILGTLLIHEGELLELTQASTILEDIINDNIPTPLVLT